MLVVFKFARVRLGSLLGTLFF